MDIPHEAEARAWDILPGFGRLHHPSSDATLFSSSLPVLPHGKLQLSDSRDGFSLIDDAAVSRPNKFQESVDDIDSHSIGNLLPDEDDLLTGMMDDLDLSELPDADDYDLFGSGGGMELDADFRDNLSMTGPPRFSLSSLGGGNAIPQFNIQNGAGTVAGEHPYGEHPSRTLFVRNINSNVEDSELKALFEQYGDIRTLYTTCKHRGFVMISYYDIRSARMAMRALQNKPAAEVSYIHQPIAWKRQQQMPPQRTFVVQEMHEAKMVNVVEGLKLYDKMIDAKEVSQLVSLANNLRITGRRGQLQSEAYVAYKRPNRGHGREMIQLGLPIADIPPGTVSIKDRRIEPIPSVLLDIIERLVSKQIIPVKPDACIIDFFNEGDYSQPHMYLPWFGRPVGVLSLSECDVTFGRVIVSDQRGDYKGSLKLSLTPGSVLLVEGESADLAKYAIHSTRNQRIFITFTKSHQPPPQPRKPIPGTGVFLPPDSTQTTLLI